jgi:hypothetical protein
MCVGIWVERPYVEHLVSRPNTTVILSIEWVALARIRKVTPRDSLPFLFCDFLWVLQATVTTVLPTKPMQLQYSFKFITQ